MRWPAGSDTLPSAEGAQAQLGTLQVHEDADRAAQLGLDRADHGVHLAVLLVAAVAEVEPEHVGAGLDQRADGRYLALAGPSVDRILVNLVGVMGVCL